MGTWRVRFRGGHYHAVFMDYPPFALPHKRIVKPDILTKALNDLSDQPADGRSTYQASAREKKVPLSCGNQSKGRHKLVIDICRIHPSPRSTGCRGSGGRRIGICGIGRGRVGGAWGDRSGSAFRRGATGIQAALKEKGSALMEYTFLALENHPLLRGFAQQIPGTNSRSRGAGRQGCAG